MSFRLLVDTAAWRTHLVDERDRVAATGATLVPVIKGNGYGFGEDLLLREVVRLGLEVIAVGTVMEARDVLARHDHGFVGDIVVLAPWDTRDPIAMQVWNEVESFDNSHRLVRTVSSVEMLAQVGRRRHLIETASSMHRFGIAPEHAAGLVDSVSEGVSIHLPLVQPNVSGARIGLSGATGRTVEAIDALATATSEAARSGAEAGSSLWVSHLEDSELRQLVAHANGARVFLRSGTRLWLGRRDAVHALGTVLAVHEDVEAPVGYRQRSWPREATLVVVGGGTAHGVALEAPAAGANARQRAVSVASGVLEAAGRLRSPFHVGGPQGPQAWFAEPPHMHVSLLWLPRSASVPAVGEEMHCDVRFTTVHPDAVTLG